MAYSKGVDYYLYSDLPDIRIDVHAPKVDRFHGPEANFKRHQLQISSGNIPTGFDGRLFFYTRRNGELVFEQWQDINTRTGNLQHGTMKQMFNTQPLIGDAATGKPTVCWGFYDAGGGGGISILTNRHQLYVYVTRDQRRWMTELTDRDPRIAHGPFARFALPGSHDAGMWDTLAMRQILGSNRLARALLGVLNATPVIGAALAALAGRAIGSRGIANISMTQKDGILANLNVGARYFDFRPGIMHPNLSTFAPGVRFHQHLMIPGQPYRAFLEQVLRWLNDTPGEIVVVSANTQGMADSRMHPSAADLKGDLDFALNKVGASPAIKIGDRSHLEHSYKELVDSNTRLIFLNQIEDETSKYDSWDARYATLTPGPVIEAFKEMTREMPIRPADPNRMTIQPIRYKDYVVMQMQAMSPAMGIGVLWPALITDSDASSPLMATKGVMDAATNPWLREHAAKNLPPEHLLVFLNDFVDNCMVETAIKVTEQRAHD